MSSDQTNSVKLVLFIDGARLDEFTCSSGESAFLKFLDAGDLQHCRQLIPIFATAVHHGKDKDASVYESANGDKYICSMMEAVLDYMKPDIWFDMVLIWFHMV